MLPSLLVFNYIGASNYPATLLVMADGTTQSLLFNPNRNRIQFILDVNRDT